MSTLITKDKKNREKQTPETHAQDRVVLATRATSNFMKPDKFHTAHTRGHLWIGEVLVTRTPFRIIARPNLFHRQLNFENRITTNIFVMNLKKRCIKY